MKIQNLSLRRSSFELGPLNFSFESSGLYFVQGKNGTGKTSLIRALMQRLKSCEGEAFGIPEKFLYLGSEAFFFEDWSLMENFRFFSALLKQKKEFPPALASSKNRSFKSLSKGQKRKAELLLLLNFDSPLFLLDEAFTHLDSEEKKALQELIARTSERALIICSIHQSDEIFGDSKGVLQL